MSGSAEHRAILGVGHDATAAEIRAAFRRAAKRAHPDAGGSSDAFRRVRAAADALLEELKTGRRPQADPPPAEADRTGLKGHWMTVGLDLRRQWGLTREPATVIAPQKLGLSPFVEGTRLNLQAYDWLVRAVGRRGEAWDFHVAGTVTRIFFRRSDDARQFQLRYF